MRQGVMKKALSDNVGLRPYMSLLVLATTRQSWLHVVAGVASPRLRFVVAVSESRLIRGTTANPM